MDLDKNPITEKDLYNDKVGILDVKAVLNNDVVCNIEMQMVNQAGIEKRLMFYWGKIYTAGLKEGESYNKLKKTVVILIGNFRVPKLHEIQKAHTVWQLREKEYSKMLLTNICEIHIIELPKLKELINGLRR